MFASIIIKTYNRPYLLKRLLLSLVSQTLQPEHFEIIVVNDGADSETTKICNSILTELPNLKLISISEQIGVASAVNLGIRSAKGDYFLFTDDDCIAREDWAEHMRDALKKKPIIAGSISSPVSNYIKLCHNISAFHPFMRGRKPGTVEFISGANMGITRSVLEELNGFQEGRMLAFDTEFILWARKKGYRAHFSHYAEVIHDPDRTNLLTVLSHSALHSSVTILLRNQYKELLKTPFVLCSPILILFAAPLIALMATMDIYLRNFSLARRFWTLPLVYVIKLAWCWGAFNGLRKKRFLNERIRAK